MNTDLQKSAHIKIYIFTSESFPQGMAATNRIISYARGFLKHHLQVEVICFRKTENRKFIRNNEVNGVYRGIPFRYLSGSTIKSGYFLLRQVDNILMDMRLSLFSIKCLNKKSFSIYYSSHTSVAIILRVASWIKKSKIFKEVGEHPSVYIKFKSIPIIHLYSRLHYGLFDGLFIMTNKLVVYFKEKMYYKKPLLHVPMTVDIERFQLKKIKKKTIVYCEC